MPVRIDTGKAFMLDEQIMTQNTMTKDENHKLKKYCKSTI